MRLHCFHCGTSVSNELPEDTIVRAILECPECIEKLNPDALEYARYILATPDAEMLAADILNARILIAWWQQWSATREILLYFRANEEERLELVQRANAAVEGKHAGKS